MVNLPRQLIYQGGHSIKPIAPPKYSHRGGRSNNAVVSRRRLVHLSGHSTEQTLSPIGWKYEVVAPPKHLTNLVVLTK